MSQTDTGTGGKMRLRSNKDPNEESEDEGRRNPSSMEANPTTSTQTPADQQLNPLTDIPPKDDQTHSDLDNVGFAGGEAQLASPDGQEGKNPRQSFTDLRGRSPSRRPTSVQDSWKEDDAQNSQIPSQQGAVSVPEAVFNTLRAQGETIMQIQETLRNMTLALNLGPTASALTSPVGHSPPINPTSVPRNVEPPEPLSSFNRRTNVPPRQEEVGEAWPRAQASAGIHQPAEPRDYRPRSSSPMSRWRLTFDGTKSSMSVEDLVYRLNKLQRMDNVSEQYMVQNFHRILKGKADQWYWGFDRDYPAASWNMLKNALLIQFGGHTDDNEILVEMTSRKQGARESFDDFLSAIQLLNNRRYQRLSDHELIRIIRRNLNTRLATMVYMVQFRSIIDFRQGCLDAERFINSRPSQYTDTKGIHEFSTELELAGPETVEAFHTNKQAPLQPPVNKSTWRCWNCDQASHGYRECHTPFTGLFCFRCGLKGAITPTCVRCAPGNATTLVRTTGDRRQTTFPGTNNGPPTFPYPPPLPK